MITSLHIRNIGIIDDLKVDFNYGLNILSGETGAGKTLIVGALEILAGGRFSKEMIRNGEEYSFVEMCLYLPKKEEAIEGNIIISREVYVTGRNLCKINGRMVTVHELKNFMRNMMDIHGQHDSQILFDSSSHICYLDEFSGKELVEIKRSYQDLYEKYEELKEELKRNYGDDKEKQRKLDLLQYQLNEIKEADLKVKEEEELEEKRMVILNAEKLAENLNQADEELSNVAIDSISNAIRSLEKIETIESHIPERLNELKSIYYELQETERDINDIKGKMEFDDQERKQIEERLDLIFSLKRKYGNDIKEILLYKEQIEQEIFSIQNLEEYNKELKKEMSQIENKLKELSNKMHIIRKQYASKIVEKINKELQCLEMKNACFEIQIDLLEQFNRNGQDKVEFMICTNSGEKAKPLTKIASGGEMSRIMLAIKTVLADVDHTPILVFDEIDTGISGKAAKAVGEKLKAIAKNHQLITITHLAPIAAKGDHNYYIYKQTTQGKTKTNIRKLTEKETIQEIARIATGELTDIAMQHAKELRAS